MALNTLERIVKLGDQLAPLGKKTQGMRIEAQEWNTLVEVMTGILEIDRAQDSGQTTVLATRFADREHEHLGAVTLAWLDAELQSRIGDGGSTAGLRAALADATKKVSSLSAEVARLTAALEEQQRAADRAATTELDRARKLAEFEKRFGGLEDLRTLVGTLSGQMGGLSKNVDAVLELKKSLLDASGAPIDVAGLKEQVSDLEKLRENFNGVDGKPLRMRDIELMLKELELSTDVAGLDQRFGALEAALDDKLELDLKSSIEELSSHFDASLIASATGLRAELDAKLEVARAGLEQGLAIQLSDEQASLRADLDERLKVGLDAARDGATLAAKDAVDARLESLPAQIRDGVAVEVKTVEASLRESLSEEVTKSVRSELPEAMSPFEKRIIELEGRVGKELGTLSERIDERVLAEITELDVKLDARVTSGLAAIRTSLETSLGERTRADLATEFATLDARVDSSVARSLSDLDARVASSVAIAVSDVPGEIQTEVANQLRAADVSGQIQRASGTLSQQLRTEMGTLGADLRAVISANTRDTVTSLNQQITAAQRRAVQESAALVAQSEQRLNVRIEQRSPELRLGRPVG
jgi:hypothetical protein